MVLRREELYWFQLVGYWDGTAELHPILPRITHCAFSGRMRLLSSPRTDVACGSLLRRDSTKVLVHTALAFKSASCSRNRHSRE
jgi:hypothetical protein